MEADATQSGESPEQVQPVGPAGAYAQALLELATEQGRPEQVAEEIDCLAQVTRQVDVLPVFFIDPVIPLERKREVLARGLGGRLSPLVVEFLNVLLRRRRTALLEAIIEQYRGLLWARQRRVQVNVEVAVPLEQALRAELEAVLANQLNLTPVLQVKVDPELLGGLRLRIGGRVVDVSLSGRLDRLRDALIRSRIP